MSELLRLSTDQIKRDDIVHTHGMRVLMDTDPVTSRDHAGPLSGRTCYAWVGLVLNPDDVPEDYIPRSWLYTDGIGQPRTEPRWNVQGNELAFWSVERP